MLAVNHLIGFGAEAGAWQTALNPTLNSDYGSFSGYTMRTIVAAAALSGPSAANRARVTLACPTAGTTPIINAFIGHVAASGDVYDFDGKQSRITFGGANGVILGTGGADVLSDEFSFSFDKSRNLMISMDINTGTVNVRANQAIGANYEIYFKSASAEAGTSDVTGYTRAGTGGFWAAAKLIEVFG